MNGSEWVSDAKMHTLVKVIISFRNKKVAIEEAPWNRF